MPPKQNEFSGTLYGKSSTGEIVKIADIKDVTITEVDVALGSFDYVRVVRCKDCKYYVLYELFGRSQGWCERLCDKFDKSLARGTEDDDFCSHGERREAE